MINDPNLKQYKEYWYNYIEGLRIHIDQIPWWRILERRVMKRYLSKGIDNFNYFNWLFHYTLFEKRTDLLLEIEKLIEKRTFWERNFNLLFTTFRYIILGCYLYILYYIFITPYL